MSSINPTIVISSTDICESLYSSFRRNLYQTYGNDKASLIEKKCVFLALNNYLVSDNRTQWAESIDRPSDDWNIQEIWENLLSKKNQILDGISGIVIPEIRNAFDNQEILQNCKINVNDKTSFIVVLQLYKPFESVFLSFLIKHIFSHYGNVEFNFHIIGLFPELDNNIKKSLNSFEYERTYATLTECEAFLENQQDLINSFSLISNTNESNNVIGSLPDFFPFFDELINKIFFNSNFSLDNRSASLSNNRGKTGFFSTLGYSSFQYNKKRFIEQYRNRLSVSVIDYFLDFPSHHKIPREILNAQVESFCLEKKWDNKQELLEGENGYEAFSKISNLNYVSLAEENSIAIGNKIEKFKLSHEDAAHGYFRQKYIEFLNQNVLNQINNHKALLLDFVEEKLEKGLEGYSQLVPFLYGFIGKESNNALLGASTHNSVNLRSLRFELADEYRKRLSEEEQIFSSNIIGLEKTVKNKQSELEKYRKEIEDLEANMFGWSEPVDDILEQTEGKLYFTINEKQVSITGALDYEGSIPERIREYAPQESGNDLPKKVDIRSHLTPVEDQSQIGSCVANALVGAYEYLVKRATNKIKDFSRLFVYYNGRRKGGSEISDNGSSICLSLESMIESGVCLESIWPYNTALVNQKPSAEAHTQAEDYKVVEAEYFASDISAMKHCLAEGFPFIISLKLFNSFQKASERGIVPMPVDEEQISSVHGHHAMLCVGYSDEDGYFIVRNSWGNQWGDSGYCYIPYEYVANNNLRSDSNNYVIKTISDVAVVNLKTGIASEEGSIFNFGNDLIKLKTKKELFSKLKEELKELEKKYLTEIEKFEIQNNELLTDSFRSSAEMKDLEENINETKELLDELNENEKKLNNFNEIRDGLNIKRKKSILRYFIIYPSLFLTLLIVAGFIFINIWSLEQLLKMLLNNLMLIIGTSVILALVYLLLTYFKLKNNIFDPLKNNEFNRNDCLDDKRRIVRDMLLKLDEYFEIKRKHKLNSYYNLFIEEITKFIEQQKNELKTWEKKLQILKERNLTDSPDEDFVDSYLIKNACHLASILDLIKSLSCGNDFFEANKKSLKPYFMLTGNNLNIADGFQSFEDEISKFINKKSEVIELSQLTIFDFLCKTEAAKRIFSNLKKESSELKDIIKLIFEASTPFVNIKAYADALNFNNKLEIQYPRDDTKCCVDFLTYIKTNLLKTGELATEFHNNNEDVSSIVIFRTKSLLPAYVIQSVQNCYNKFKNLKKADKEKIHIWKEFANSSCMPQEI